MDPQVLAIVADAGLRAGQHAIELTLRNQSPETVLIDPYNLCGSEGLRDQIFEIVDGNGRAVRYTGRLYKRGEPDFATFRKLRPGAKLTQTCRLDEMYKFEGTQPPYRIKYSVYNMHPEIDYFEIESAPVTTSF